VMSKFCSIAIIFFALVFFLAGYSSSGSGQNTQTANHIYSQATSSFMTWNTFLGGSLYDNGNAIAVDTSGNIYIVGDSWTTWGGSPIRPFGGNTDAFVAKLNGSEADGR